MSSVIRSGHFNGIGYEFTRPIDTPNFKGFLFQLTFNFGYDIIVNLFLSTKVDGNNRMVCEWTVLGIETVDSKYKDHILSMSDVFAKWMVQQIIKQACSPEEH